jgi:hypothetical protein
MPQPFDSDLFRTEIPNGSLVNMTVTAFCIALERQFEF